MKWSTSSQIEFGMIRFLSLTILILTNNCSSSSNSNISQNFDGIGFDILIQGVSQMKTKWAKNAQTIQSSCVDSLNIYSDKIIQSLKPFERSVKHIKATAEILHSGHNFKDYTWDTVKHYYPDRSNRSEPVELVGEFSNKTQVNFNTSFMQIPTDLFNQRSDLLNEIKWSKRLDDQFKMLRKQESLLTWQYIGFVTGASRNYPGSHVTPS